jgi:hypothetical protein
LCERALDFTAPIGLFLVGVLHFIDDSDEPYRAVAEFVTALPSGSYVAVSHVTFDPLPAEQARQLTSLCDPAAGHAPSAPAPATRPNSFSTACTSCHQACAQRAAQNLAARSAI